MQETLGHNWKEYSAEALGLGLFMVSACTFSVLLFHPASPASSIAIAIKLVMMGAAMGLTAVAIFKSPFGKLSGAHINPAVTLTFWRLGKIKTGDALYYVLFQFIGAAAGVLLSWIALGGTLADSAVNFAVTVPDSSGPIVSFASEFAISFGMMATVLVASNHRSLAKFTPFLAGTLVAGYIALESPVSGMSMNPARTFGSALFAANWTSWWIYFTAPPLAMLAAAEVFVRLRGPHAVLCAKLDHDSRYGCIFDCQKSSVGSRASGVGKKSIGLSTRDSRPTTLDSRLSTRDSRPPTTDH